MRKLGLLVAALVGASALAACGETSLSGSTTAERQGTKKLVSSSSRKSAPAPVDRAPAAPADGVRQKAVGKSASATAKAFAYLGEPVAVFAAPEAPRRGTFLYAPLAVLERREAKPFAFMFTALTSAW
jgi:hypothetical protein